ncbi:hypothetical protein F8388_014149 [Cannabis sativa]|uniref:SCP domain-containing protein n=1 Tax=Cannabis sativa TaxID=3483 RepID=A0A7J6GNG1_CANSA|nr:hypothetical protein F8388_014149 [Cannabis sativa]
MSLNHKASIKVLLMGQILMVMMMIMIASTTSKPFPSKKSSHHKHSHNKHSHFDFLDTHNAIRAEVGVGPMTWNKTLVAYARNYANSMVSKNCELEHSGGIYGENLAAGYGEMTGEQAVKFWATEKTMYDYTSNTCKEEDGCGHYLQVVWRNSIRLGCATTKCSNNGLVFVICSYDPPGNYIGQRPY